MSVAVCAFVFARGGSKGVPRKNLRVVGGSSLLARSIGVAQAVTDTSRVFVSTDDDEIALHAKRLGAQVIRRGPSLSGDDSPEWLAWQHAITTVRDLGVPCDVLVSVPTTAPLRDTEDVERCVKALDESADCVVTMVRSAHHPAFNMVTRDETGVVHLGLTGDLPLSRRQDAPELYSLTTVAYAARADYVLSNQSIWEGRVRGIEVPIERALDIDTEWDLHVADLVLSERGKNG